TILQEGQEGPEGYSGQALRECAYVEESRQKQARRRPNNERSVLWSMGMDAMDETESEQSARMCDVRGGEEMWYGERDILDASWGGGPDRRPLRPLQENRSTRDRREGERRKEG
ncbi:hypothetical protein VTO73DRAFT_3268, partial [Trametes versicolor]